MADPMSGHAMLITGSSQKQAWDRGVLPPVEEVRPDLWSIPVPMGNNPLRYSFSYALLGADEVLLVDPGWPSEESFRVLDAGLRAAGRSTAAVSGVLVTHAHHDHYGLVDRVRDASGGWAALHGLDADLQLLEEHDHDEVLAARRAWLRRCGASADEAAEHGGDLEMIRRSAVRRGPDRRLVGGERFRIGPFDLEAIWTPGHSPGHVVFYERSERVLLSGDHVLPRITPNISAFVGHDVNGLLSYLDSLRKVATLDVTEVLPGHEYRFSGLRARTDDLLDHHERRLEEIVAVMAPRETLTPWTISERLIWSRPWTELKGFSRRAAVGETVAHLHLLRTRGAVELLDRATTWGWRPASAPADAAPSRGGQPTVGETR